MKSNYLFIALFVAIALSGAILVLADAESIAFPVIVLDNCGNKDECKKYCDASENITACVDFAEENNLMSEGEAVRAKHFSQIIMSDGGPGNCKSPSECKSFCDDIAHINECLAFVEKEGYEGEEIEEAKKVRDYLNGGGTMPGGCGNKSECDNYCGDISHIEECLVFAVNVGFIDEREAEIMIKTGGRGPGGCASEKSCESYCLNNIEECINFAKQYGLIDEEEILPSASQPASEVTSVLISGNTSLLSSVIYAFSPLLPFVALLNGN